jgi:hypothetical protein
LRYDVFAPWKNDMHRGNVHSSSFLTKIHSSRIRIRLVTECNTQTKFTAVHRELSRSTGTVGKLVVNSAELIPSDWGKRRGVSNSTEYEMKI